MGERIINRRSGPDALDKLNGLMTVFFRVFIVAASVFSWIFIASIFIFTQVAKFSKEYSNLQLPADTWKIFIGYTLFLLVLVFVLCTIGLTLEFYRHHRKTDKYDKLFIFFGILSFIGIIIHSLLF